MNLFKSNQLILLDNLTLNKVIEVEKILQKDAQMINHRFDKNRTPLHFAVQKDSADLVKILLSMGADINAVDNNKESPWEEANFRGSFDIIRMFLEHGADVNHIHSDCYCQTPIYNAIMEGSLELVELLISYGADINTVDEEGRTPLFWAKILHQEHLIDLLKSKGGSTIFDWPLENFKLWTQSNYKEYIESLPKEVLKNPDFESTSGFGDIDSPLTLAASEINKIKVLSLLAIGSNANWKSRPKEWTPLHYLTEFPHLIKESKQEELLFCTLSLLKFGANINEQNWIGETPLHLAAKNGNYYYAHILIMNGADITVQDNSGNTPLFNTVPLIRDPLSIPHIGDIQIDLFKTAELLVQNGIDLNAKNISNDTALHKSIREEKFDIAELLILQGADVEVQNTYKETPLHLVAWKENEPIAELLIQKGARIDIPNYENQTPIDISKNKSTSFSEFLKNTFFKYNK